MSSPTAGRDTSVSQHLHATEKILQGVIFNAKIAGTADVAEVDTLERGAFEVLRLVRVWKNMLAPINKVPREILALIPDFWDTCDRDEDVIALTHVCRAWREVFVSRSSLWTNFDCSDEEKTRVYFERSKSSPINLSLDLSMGVSFYNPYFQIIPHATGRLKSLSVKGSLEDVRVITPRLSHPAPLLKHLSIISLCEGTPYRYLPLTSALFNGDLSSLRTLRLEFVQTELPWRNMANLTSFTLYHPQPGAVSAGQLLDFLESAPYLEEVELLSATPTTGVQDGRLVSLACLKSMYICDDGPSSPLLDHLLIPAGAKLEIRAGLTTSLIGGCLPRSLDNLKNFSDFTTIELYPRSYCSKMRFSGPNGQVNITLRSLGDVPTDFALGSLAEFDSSKTERLKIDCGHLPSGDPLYQALLPMKDLRTLMLTKCRSPHILIHALQPPKILLGAMVCPKLEEIILVLRFEETFDITSMEEMAAARASRGGKLTTVRIVGGRRTANLDTSELMEHVWNVEYDNAD